MKKIVALILVVVMCASLTACGGGNATVNNNDYVQQPASAIDLLNQNERCLFDAIIKMTSDGFYEPAAVRVLAVGDYENRTQYKDSNFSDSLYGPDTVVVYLQGNNQFGGTANKYYLVCVGDGENMSETSQSLIKSLTALGYMDQVLSYKGVIGDYAELEDNYSFTTDASNIFNVGNVNNALKEYWTNLGF